jgi:hypothetical protein
VHITVGRLTTDHSADAGDAAIANTLSGCAETR